MKRILSSIAAAALALGMAACGSGSENEELRPSPPVEQPGTETSPESGPAAVHPDGTLIVETKEWAKAAVRSGEVHQFDPVVDTEYLVSNSFDEHSLEILDVTDSQITVLFSGYFITPEGRMADPEFTLRDGQSVTFETASEDAGTIFTLTYEK